MNEPRVTTSEHRALADEHRVRIVDELGHSPGGLDARELGRRLALHPNTIRWHLAILEEADLVSARPEPRTAPGRPRILYRLNPASRPNHEDHRLLAAVLAGSLSELPDGPERAAAAGRAWGSYLVRRPPSSPQLSDEEAVGEVVAFLAREDFRPEVDDHEIRMQQCPFQELARTGSRIVCAVHRGLISGALAELGSRLEVERLDPFVEPQLCIATLAPRTAGSSAAPARPG